MPVSNSVRKACVVRGRKARARQEKIGVRRAAIFVRNEPGFRFVRDESKSGIASKKVPR